MDVMHVCIYVCMDMDREIDDGEGKGKGGLEDWLIGLNSGVI